MYDIITTGSATVDVFASTQSQLVKFVTSDGEEDFIAYPSGSKILIKNLNFLVGGGGTNTAVSFSRLGFKTAYLGNLGLDANSRRILDLLEEEHIEFIGLRSGQTGYSIILDSLEKDRTILTFKGANDHLHFKDLDSDKLHAKWIYSSSLTGESLGALESLVQLAQERNIRVAFNPSSYQVKHGYEPLKNILEKCTVLVMNKEEAALLFNQKINPEFFTQFIQDYKNKYVIITDGSRGAVCYHNNEICKITPSPNITVIETTGAGDAFASGFVAGLLHNESIADSMKLGMVQAESVIGAIGAKESLLEKEVAYQRVKQFQGTVTYQEGIEHFAPSKEAKNMLPKFHESQQHEAFKFDDGHQIRSLEELGYYLKFMSKEQFNKHVSLHHNHFADWIENIFGLKNLAAQLRTVYDRKAQSSLIITFVHKGGRQ